MTRIQDKVALITGGADGLGRAIAERLKAEGADVAITDISRPAGERTAQELGFQFFLQDVADEAGWKQLAADVEARFGRLDILVNNAGILGPMGEASPEATRLDDFRRIFAINVDSVFLGCRAMIPLIARSGGGSIVNMASTASFQATPFATAYGASKAAVRHLTRSIAQHCAEQRLNIRCNSVHPGNVRTALWERQAAELAERQKVPVEELVGAARRRNPLGDLSTPQDVAAMVAFLASEDARRVTGAALMVDGGVVDCDTFREPPSDLPQASGR